MNLKGIKNFKTFTQNGWSLFAVMITMGLGSMVLLYFGIESRSIIMLEIFQVVDYLTLIPLGILFFAVLNGQEWKGLTIWKNASN